MCVFNQMCTCFGVDGGRIPRDDFLSSLVRSSAKGHGPDGEFKLHAGRVDVQAHDLCDPVTKHLVARDGIVHGHAYAWWRCQCPGGRAVRVLQRLRPNAGTSCLPSQSREAHRGRWCTLRLPLSLIHVGAWVHPQGDWEWGWSTLWITDQQPHACPPHTTHTHTTRCQQ